MPASFWQQLCFELRRLARLGLGIVPPQPQPLKLIGTQEWYMASVLRHTFALPPVTVGDLATRKVHYAVNGGPDTHKDLTAADTTFQLDFAAGDAVEISLTDIDNAGNESVPSDPLDFIAKDTFAPPKPGALGISNVEQIDLP